MTRLKDKVLALHANGLTAPEIAERLSVRTEYVRSTKRRAGLVPSLRRHKTAQLKKRISRLRRELAEAEKALRQLGMAS